jgi:hypothetical protein
MANIDNPNGFKFLYAAAGHVEFKRGFLKASETIAEGDLIARDASGRVRIWTTADSEVLGVAQSPCTSATADDEILYIAAQPGIYFHAQCSGTYAITLRDTAVDVEGTTGIMEVNENATANAVFTIRGEVDIDGQSAIGDHTRVFGEFNAA